MGLIAAFGMTIVSMVTPNWRQYKQSNTTTSLYEIVSEFTYGIITGVCKNNGRWESCENYFEDAPDWKKASMGCLVASLAFCAVAFVWSCVACCMCCCKACLTPPLPILAGLACMMDIAGVTIYGVKSGQSLGTIPMTVQSWQDLESKGDFGYSMWIGIAAIGVLFIVTLIGFVLMKVSKVSPL